MTCRRLKPRFDDIGWIEHGTPGPLKLSEWPQGLKVTVIAEIGSRDYRVRDEAGREIELPHWNVDVGYEYEIDGKWLPEWEPEALKRLREALQRETAQKPRPEIERAHAEYVESLRRILRRNGW